jgi:hypothetical protein
MVWSFLVTGAIVLAAFVFWQSRAPHPLLPLTVLADRNRGAALSTVFIASAGMFGVFLFLTTTCSRRWPTDRSRADWPSYPWWARSW